MITEARYTSPSGKETAFNWESGKRKTELKTGVFTFPGRDGAHVQHQGAGARSFPLVCIFSGGNYMARADAFEDMLIERGAGELQHPLYGTLKVVPTGDIEREDDPVNRLGESTVTITFTETITEESGDMQAVAADDIDKKLDEFSDAAVSDFASALKTKDIATQNAVKSALKQQTNSILKNLEPLAGMDAKSYAKWLGAAKEIKGRIMSLYNQGADILKTVEDFYNEALDIGRLALFIIKLPSTISISLAEKIKGYATLTADLVNQYKNDPFGIEKIKASYAAASLAITGACAAIASGSALTIAQIAMMTGVVPSSNTAQGKKASAAAASDAASDEAEITAGTTSRESAVEAAAQVIAFYENVKDFQDEKIENLNMQNMESEDYYIDANPTVHLALAELVQASAQLILNASFGLPMQKTITLDRDRQAVELCAELYGSTDFLDELIMQNNFNIDEIELLPMGRKVSYYVKSA